MSNTRDSLAIGWPQKLRSNLFPGLILATAVVLAVGWRFYHLGEAPPALNGDEAVFGSGALYLLEHGPRLYIEGQGGGGILASYIVAFFFWLFEPGKLALRFQASFISSLTVLFLFYTTKAIFLSLGTKQAKLIAALAALILALDYDHITITRIAFAIGQLPFLQLLAVWLFWFGYQKTGHHRGRYCWLGGCALGVVLYGYIAGLMTPGIFVAFLVLSFITTRRWPKRETVWAVLSQESYAGLKSYAFGFGLAVFPLLLAYLSQADQGSVSRASEASFLNPNVNQGDLWGMLWRGLWGNYTAFGLEPLAWLRQGQWGLFVSAPLQLAGFVGLVITLFRLKKEPYQFILLWWGLTILPAALAPTAIPYPSRAIGVFPPLSILTALTIVEVGRLVGRGVQQLRPGTFLARSTGGAVIGIIILSWLGLSIWRTSANQFDYYFNIWAKDEATFTAFDLYAVHLAQDMDNLAGSQSAFLLPRNTSAGSVSPNGTINFLYALANRSAKHYWITDDESTLPEALTTVAKGVVTLHVVRWKASKHSGADPKEVFRYYLEKYGQQLERQTFRFYDIETYRLTEAGVSFLASELLEEAVENFADQIWLTGYAYGSAGSMEPEAQRVHAGQPLWARLRWQKRADHVEDLKVSLILKDAGGRRVKFVDKYLQNNFWHQRSKAWPLDSSEDTYFIVPVPVEIMPGSYTLSALVYGDQTLNPLPLSGSGQLELVLGTVQVEPALTPIQGLPADVALQLVGRLPEGLELYLDPVTIPDQTRPGQRLAPRVYWRADDQLGVDFTYEIRLQGEGTDQVLSPKARLGGRAHPTSRWRSGERLATWLDFQIPPGTSGMPTVNIIVWQEKRQVASWPLKTVLVVDWVHNYTLPDQLVSVAAALGETIQLAGYNIDLSETEAGQTLNLTLFWQSSQPINQDYIAFVHLLAADGQLISQQDRIPGGGAFPTTGWLPDEIIIDQYSFELPMTADLKRGGLAIGMYDQNDFQRLPVILAGQKDDKVFIPLPF